jgi:hypothetical protein
MDIIKKAQEHPVIFAVGAVLGALALIASAWQFFDTDKSAFEALMGFVTLTIGAGAIVATTVVLGLLVCVGALVAVVIGSVRNRKQAQDLTATLTSLTAERNELKSLVATMANQYQALAGEHRETKRNIAIDSMRRHSGMKFGGDDSPQPVVTIRCADYAADYDLAKNIQKVIREHTSWKAEIDTSNKPSLERADKFKVIFESGWVGAYKQLAYDFSQSELLELPVGHRSADRSDQHHLIIFVYPNG